MRKCNCSGTCGPQGSELSRRDFIGLMGAGTTALLTAPAWGAFELPADELERWRRELFAPAKPRVYLSDRHTDARLHLGGIGTGNFEMGADGRLGTWQLFNTLRDGQVPFHFVVKAGQTARLLQAAGGPEWPRVKQIEMTGDYPLASLRFDDAALPVQIQLRAFSPFAPLDAAFSSMPLAVFVFSIANPSTQPQTVSLAALMQNPVGYDAAGENNSSLNACFGHNINEVLQEGNARGLFMRAQAAGEPALDKPVTLCTAANLKPLTAAPADRPENLRVQVLEGQAVPAAKPADPAQTVIWLEDPATNLSAAFLRAARDAVRAGATLVFSGRAMPLLRAYASWTGGKPVARIEFTDLPGDRGVMALLEELLPARFSGVRALDNRPGGPPGVSFDNLVLESGATESDVPGPRLGLGQGPRLITRALGQGRVVLAAGPVLEPAHAALSHQRQRAYAFLCGLVGARYSVPGGLHPKAPGFGTLALAALGGEVTVLPACEELDEAWSLFSTAGRFAPLPSAQPNPPSPLGRTINGAVAATVNVPPGATLEVPFLLAWHYPNKYNGSQTWMGCHYATRWADARAVIRAAAADYPVLLDRTEGFRRSFYDSTLPHWLLDCVTANIAIIRHIGVVFRIANGDVYGWEGSNGCCAPTCTHVWGYEQSLSRLFPDLEKDMRRIDFKRQQRPEGGVNNRTDVPSPPHPSGEQPFSDGHASCILKAYREALNHPDDSFLGEYWPHINRAVEYLIARDAKTSGGQPGGILQDDQWNTYDEALHGVTTFISGYYLAALLAGEAWARRMGQTAAAERFRAVFEKGRQRLVELCWNGEYFQQHLPDYLDRQGEVGPGCMADQLIGQWWAHQLGLGYILPKDKVAASLRAIFKHNFKSDLTGWQHAPRAFAGAKDKGLIICTWPKGGRPAQVMLYSDEVWTGIEYQVAAHMLYEGLIEEGLAIVKAARDRYDGLPRPPIPRNPWNEIECGGHYARAMSSWSLLLALSGWNYDGPRRALRVGPRHTPANFKCPFTGPEGWGSLAQTRDAQGQLDQLIVREGRFTVAEITLEAVAAPKTADIRLDGQPLESAFAFAAGAGVVSLKQPVTLAAGQTLSIRLA